MCGNGEWAIITLNVCGWLGATCKTKQIHNIYNTVLTWYKLVDKDKQDPAGWQTMSLPHNVSTSKR